MWTLIIYAVMALGAASAFGLYHHSITVAGEQVGAQKQFAADKPILEACDRHGNKEPAKCAAFIDAIIAQEAQRESELKACGDAASRQNAAIDRITANTASALAAAQAAKAKQAATQKDFDLRQANLAAIAAGHQTKAKGCEDELARVNSVLDGYRRRVQ